MQAPMSPRNIALAQILTYSGTLPLIIAIILAYLHIESFDVLFVVRCYVATIIAFICGMHWSIFMFFSARCKVNMLITSNIVTLMAWLTLIMPDIKFALVMQSICMLYMLLVDYRLKRAAVIPLWFYALRHNATAIVIFCIFMLEFL